MADLRSGIEHLKQAKAHMSDANGIMNGHISKLKALEEENAELKAELADWKCNAEGFQPDAYMKLPLDADGETIRIGDEVNIDGDVMTVLGYRLHNDMLLLVAKDKKSGLFFTPKPSIVSHFKPEPADSWEKLEEDLGRICSDGGEPWFCNYANEGTTTRNICQENCKFFYPDDQLSCRNQAVNDIASRIRKLRGESDA